MSFTVQTVEIQLIWCSDCVLVNELHVFLPSLFFFNTNLQSESFSSPPPSLSSLLFLFSSWPPPQRLLLLQVLLLVVQFLPVCSGVSSTVALLTDWLPASPLVYRICPLLPPSSPRSCPLPPGQEVCCVLIRWFSFLQRDAVTPLHRPESHNMNQTSLTFSSF